MNVSDPQFVDAIFSRSLMICNRIVVRNTATARLALEEMLHLCEDDTLLAPYPNEGAHPEMHWHTADQAVVNAYLYNQQYLGNLPKYWPKYGYKSMREFTRENLILWLES